MSSSPLIMTKHGPIQGTTHNGVRVWRGVPFARPPVGPLRFRAPQPPDTWTTARDATTFGPMAWQPRNMLGSVSFSSEPPPRQANEDCLTLNIYAPASDDRQRPVMVWIHGGAYYAGYAAQYDGSRLAANGDVVVVTCNYRLGPFGYLDFSDLAGGDGPFDSNLGIRDQIAALQWVRENIAAFGGDPQWVTIFGESAGGSSVINLLASPAARGLFRHAIAQSALPASVVDRATATAMATVYLKHLGIRPADVARVTKLPAEQLLGAIKGYMPESVATWTGTMAFSPMYGDDILPEAPLHALRAGVAGGVPLLIGTNHDESTLFQSPANLFPTTPPLIHKMFAHLGVTGEGAIIAAYQGYPEKSALMAITRDGLFRIPTIRAAEAQAEHAPTWMYRFDWSSPGLRWRGLNATHGIEIPFILDQLDSKTARLLTTFARRADVRALSRRMQACWVAFARHGRLDEDWLPYDPANGRYTLIFDAADRGERDPDSKQRQAWDGVFM